MKKLTLVLAGCLLASFTHADDTSFAWGPLADINGTYLVGDSGGTAFNANAMIVLGAFDAAFDIDANKNDLTAIFNNLQLVGTTQTLGGPQSGFFSGDNTIEVDTSGIAGDLAYMWVLPGVTTYDLPSVLGVTEHAILRNSTWNLIPAGGAPIPTDYDIQTTTLDTLVVGGTNVGGGAFGGDMYTTASVNVPEPSLYAALLGAVSLLVVRLRRRRA